MKHVTEWDDAGLPFPTREMLELTDIVSGALRDLEQAARGEHAAWALSGAFSVLVNRCTGSTRIAEHDRDALLDAVERAHGTAACLLPIDYPRGQLRTGMTALKALVWRWAEDEQARAARPPGMMADLRAFARMLQNDLHNISLGEEVRDRASRRAAGWLDIAGRISSQGFLQ